MIARTQHLANVSVTKLSFAVDFDRGTFWSGADLGEARLFEAAIFVEAIAHRD